MQTSLPAVQWNVKRSTRGYVLFHWKRRAEDKRYANRLYRRRLNSLTRRFGHDPDLFDDEPFDTPTLSIWDLI